MSTSNWEEGKARSNYHFDWNRQEVPGYDCRWFARFEGNWETELEKIKRIAEPMTWRTRGKQYHADYPDLEAEENDLINAGMGKDTVILRKVFEFEGIWKVMIDELALENTKQAFHIQYPGEMLNVHVYKQYEMNDSPEKVARFFIFLEDWKPGHFMQMGTTFLKWRRGDLVWFDWPNIPHASANAGWEPRCLIQITGTMTDATKEIMLGQRQTISV